MEGRREVYKRRLLESKKAKVKSKNIARAGFKY